MLEIYGFEITWLLVAQAAVTVALVTGYVMLTTSGNLSRLQTAIAQAVTLEAFLCKYHPEIDSVYDIAVSRKQGGRPEDDPTSMLHDQYVKRYLDQGQLPDEAELETDFPDEISSIFWETVFPPLAIALFFRPFQNRTERLDHPEQRLVWVSSGIWLMAINLILLLFTVMYVWPWNMGAGGVIIAAAALGFLGGVRWTAENISEQQAWKRYWVRRLLESIAHAEANDNRDQVIQGRLLVQHVESQPAAPFSGALFVFVALFSMSQSLLVFLSKNVFTDIL
jgi:hypothetical protein